MAKVPVLKKGAPVAKGPLRVKCTCQHEYQDRKYGVGNRVAVPCSPKNNFTRRCTVCSRGHP